MAGVTAPTHPPKTQEIVQHENRRLIFISRQFQTVYPPPTHIILFKRVVEFKVGSVSQLGLGDSIHHDSAVTISFPKLHLLDLSLLYQLGGWVWKFKSPGAVTLEPKWPE